MVLGIPRGGVSIAAEVARALQAPVETLVIRKLGVPGHEEFGFGAIGEGGARIVDEALVSQLGIASDAVERVAAREREELDRRVRLYRPGRGTMDLTGKVAVLVDDGVAMGGTMRAAIGVARGLGAARVIVAVGVASPEATAALREIADEVVAAVTPKVLSSVGEWYASFPQVSDDEVIEALDGHTRV